MNLRSRASRIVFFLLFLSTVGVVVLGLELQFQKKRVACFRSLQETGLRLSEFRTQLGSPVSFFRDDSWYCYGFDLQLYSRGMACEEVPGGAVTAYIQWRDPVMNGSFVFKMTRDLYVSFIARIFDEEGQSNNCE